MEPTRRHFAKRIARFARTRRRIANDATRHAAAAQGGIAGVAALVLLTGHIANVFVNAALFALLGVALLVILVMAVARMQRRRSDLAEAFHMEELAGDLNSRLVSAVDFLGHPEPTELTRAVIDRARQDLDLDFERRIDRSALRQYRKRVVLLLLLLVALALSPWFNLGRLADNWRGTVASLHAILFPTLYELDPGPGTHVFKIGSAASVSIRFSQYPPEEVTVAHRQVDGPSARRALRVDAAGKATVDLRGDIEAEHHLAFEFGDRATEPVVVVFTTGPILVNMQTELIYPTYTRLLPRDLEGVQDRLVGLPGTRITLGFTFSKDLASAAIAWDDGEALPLDVVGRFASVSLVHSRAARATMQVVDVHGFELEHPHVMAFDLQADEPPRLFMPKHLKAQMPFLADQLGNFGFGVRLQDDYGVASCVLAWSKSTLDDETRILDKGEIERIVAPPRRQAVAEFQNLFDGMTVEPGDLITFRATVYDNHQPTRQRASSKIYSIFIHQAGLEGAALIKDLAFGAGPFERGRIGKSMKKDAVTAPMGIRTREKARNEFKAAVSSATRAPVLRGDASGSVKKYFELLAPARFGEDDE